MKFEIYRVTHRKSGKSYIGCTTIGINKRWGLHVSDAANKKKSFVFQRAIAKYGPDSFDVTVVASATCVEEMFDLERKWIADCNTISPNGYNLTTGGDGVHNPSQETREKLRRKMLGNKYFLGRVHTTETKALMSESAKRSPEHREAISRAHKGKVLSPETRAKISASKTGVRFGKHSAERIKKMSDARREWWRRARAEHSLD